MEISQGRFLRQKNLIIIEEIGELAFSIEIFLKSDILFPMVKARHERQARKSWLQTVLPVEKQSEKVNRHQSIDNQNGLYGIGTQVSLADI